MKYLNDYTEEAQTQLFKECGSFFAFSNKQFNEKKKEGKKYVDVGAGLICEKEHVNKMSDGLENIQQLGIKQDLEENGRDKIIERELYNHECFYTGDISDCVYKLKQYGITEIEIYDTYRELAPTVEV